VGSGNKDKRKKRREAEASGQTPPAAPRAPDPGGWERPEAAGVSFELEPDADAIFLESIRAMEEGAAGGAPGWRKKKHADDAPGGEPAGVARAGRGSAAVPAEIDLHRMTLDEARVCVDRAVTEALAQIAQRGGRGEVTLKIVTGKGLHSGATGSVLPREIHRHVRQRYALQIVSIEESPADVTIGGVPIRGHFHVTLRGR
jgi:DNA-nicking Smr family endonuclease